MGIVLFIVALALVPTLFYMLLLWWLDRYEKEPVSLLVLTFVWGAVPSIIFAILFEVLADIPLHTLDPVMGSGAGDFLSTSVVGPFIEEGFKALIVLTVFLAFRREFDDVLDGIIYGAVAGLGFAFVEDVFYGLGQTDSGLSGVVTLALIRSVVFGLNHAMFTGVTGAALGYVRYAHGARKWLIPPLGFLGAWFLHGTHNTLVSLGQANDSLSCLGFIAGVAVDWTFVLALIITAAFALSHERRWLRTQLIEEVQVGRITPPEYQMLISSLRRVGARWQALASGGLRAYRWLGRLQGLATELAFRKQQVLVEHDPAWSYYDIQLLRARIDALKQSPGA